ncbi:phosphomannomutase/phosphoglucomutase [Pseudactinotalea sp. HY158]|uniref:phosphomannomutase/phosphoglucomutase n=1 Tax=unclassified Pseudactinotalea TaxID=2649176 RepID=UPI00129C38A5|nr:phosphomannomutase/phosphoglucomutase [Pseudactinotalea sp. HY158]MPV48864.1 phosphomannomutase/phosphoglucomutase [Pseudactinotalea sp. HY160]QGH68842.1 phosphomannomutase/phosphoglucomutase [Pseudactinotalea sp. HY158]
MSDLDAIVKAYDIRGLVPDQWDEDVARALGAAFTRATRGGAVVIGHDMRPSSPALAAAFARGVTEAGWDAVMIGLCSTDGLYHASGVLDLPGAMFTASHNPARYNGIKLCHAGARPVGQDTGLADVQAAAAAYLADPDSLPVAQTPGRVSERDLLASYARYLRDLVPLEGIRPLKVVIDAGNGMAGLTAGAVLDVDAGLADLGLELVRMFFDLDGTFPNHEANPLDPANLVDLQAAVIAEGADIGLAFDGDADRCFVIDERGVAVDPSALTAMVGLREAQKELDAGRPATVIHNLITSRAVPDLLGAAGAQTVRTRVGHSFIKAEMARHNAVFGGEHSAHFYFRDFFYADSGMLAAMHVLSVLGREDLALSDLGAMYTPYHASGELNHRIDDPDAALGRIRAAYADDIDSGRVRVEEFDGVTYSHWESSPRWWFNVRRSNTEPLLRLNVEAEDEDIMVKVRDGITRLIEG